MNQEMNNALVVIRTRIEMAFQRLESYGQFWILAIPRNDRVGTRSKRYDAMGTTTVWVDWRRITLSNNGKVVEGRVKSYQIMM